jgi:hypothetical protein
VPERLTDLQAALSGFSRLLLRQRKSAATGVGKLPPLHIADYGWRSTAPAASAVAPHGRLAPMNKHIHMSGLAALDATRRMPRPSKLPTLDPDPAPQAAYLERLTWLFGMGSDRRLGNMVARRRSAAVEARKFRSRYSASFTASQPKTRVKCAATTSR